MERIFQPLLFFIARCSRNELIRHIELLKTENEMLRKRLKVRAIFLKPDERARIIQLGEAIGPAVQHLLTIVRYSTYRYWIRELRNQKPKNRVGRPRTPEVIRELVLKIARETKWGYTRILGDLRKLGYTKISRQTVVNILKQEGLDPWPQRGPGTWDELLKRHADTLWQCDFFSKRVLTRTGIKQAFVMAFINVATRRVIISPSTFKLGDGWIVRQTAAFFEQAHAAGPEAKLIMRDNDKNYAAGFDEAVNAGGAQVRPTAVRAPNENAYIERFVQTIKQECLDHFLVFGLDHLDYLVREYVRYYHDCRPHQGIGNRLIAAEKCEPASIVRLEQVQCDGRLGGLLKHYHCAA